MIDSLLSQLGTVEPIDWIGMFTGIIGVSLSIKERLSAWPFFILCYSAYIYINYRSGYYASTATNAGFIFIAIYGWLKWSGLIQQDRNKEKILGISRVPRQFWPFIFATIVAGTIGIGLALSFKDSAQLPFLDAFAVINALVAQWMLSRKYIENWIFWIFSDIVYIVLFLNDQLWTSVFLFSVFILLACKGLYDWNRLILKDD